MRLLRDNSYQLFKDGKNIIFVHNSLSDKSKNELRKSMETELCHIRKKRNMNVTAPLHTPTLFCKTQAFKRIKYQASSTLTALSLSRSSPAITEIINNLRMAHLDYIPRMLAYGYKKNSYGLICGTTIATEFLHNCITLKEHLEQYPERRESTIIAALALIESKLDDDVCHLDYWIENILIDTDTSKLWLIDLEYCRFNSKVSRKEKLTFCIGYLYQHKLDKYITSDNYFNIVKMWLSEKKRKKVMYKAYSMMQ